MSFTITCDKCGEEQKLISGQISSLKNIEIEYGRIYDIKEMIIECKNCHESIAEELNC